MKNLFTLVVMTITATLVYGQKSVDDLFERYAGKDGFTTVTISGNLLKLAHCLGEENDDYDEDEWNSIPAHITQIRILAQNKDNMEVENFYDLVINRINLSNYDEFMTVKKTDQDLKMLVRSEGNRFKEFLLVSGGKDNAVVQVKGNMTYAEARKFSRNAEKNHGLKITAD